MTAPHNLLVISDLHLGDDLNARAKPEGHESHATQTERAVVQFLDHYAAQRRNGLPWRLVVDGDMIDFLSVNLYPEDLGIDGTDDERNFGFGAHCAAARKKLERVIERHRDFFVSLARFVGRGHRLHLVVGNHDADFHFREVQQDWLDALQRFWEEDGGTGELADRIEFHAWFFYVPGVAWIEHGHQYDAFCSFEDPLMPEDPARPDTLEENLGTAAMRYLGNHIPVDPDATANLSFLEYLHLLAHAENDAASKFLGGYLAVVRALGHQWLQRMRHPLKYAARKKARKERMAAIAHRAGLHSTVLERLHKLRRPPVFIDLLRLVRSVMLGRLLSTFLLVLLLPYLVYLVPWPFNVLALAIGIVLLGAFHAWMATGRENVDPTEDMRKVAVRIRKMVKTPLVIFGHSHVPLAHRTGRQTWYFNTGAWAGGSERPTPFTHMVILDTEDGVRAALCRWHEGESRELRAERIRTRRHGRSRFPAPEGATRPGLAGVPGF